MRNPLLCGCLLFTLSHVSARPFFWTDDSFRTTKVPLLKRAFSKVDHWFKEMIDAYPSSTWHWKEHIYGRTFWKNPKLLRGWLGVTDFPNLLHRYRERNTPKYYVNPLAYPGETTYRWNPDYIDDNILSIPKSESLEMWEEIHRRKKSRKWARMGKTLPKITTTYHPREIRRGQSSSEYEVYKDINHRSEELRKDEEEEAAAQERDMASLLAKRSTVLHSHERGIVRGDKSETYEVYSNLDRFMKKD